MAGVRADVRKATNWSIVFSALMIVSGIFALIVPSISGIAVTLVVGWLLLVSGAFHLGFAWRASHAGMAVWETLIAILYGAIGAYMLMNPVLGLEALTLALATYLVLEGIVEFILAFTLRPLPGSGWLLADGIVTLLLAVLIGRGWPATSAWVVGTLVGLSMFFNGLTRLMISVAVRHVTK
jgi:uncharacterized membrane protein HdeD (DUF308 family)